MLSTTTLILLLLLILSPNPPSLPPSLPQPFIRCVQTADAIASELEGLQKIGLHSASATRICVEPGLMEDMSYMAHLRQHEPWFLNPADLVSASPRIDLTYRPLREVTFRRKMRWKTPTNLSNQLSGQEPNLPKIKMLLLL
jgi:hypothetical protein